MPRAVFRPAELMKDGLVKSTCEESVGVEVAAQRP